MSFIFEKNKVIRISLQILSGLLFIWFIYNIVGKNSRETEGEKKIVGLYKLDMGNSQIEGVNLKNYSDLTLTVKSNNTFIINRKTLFLNSTMGQWNLIDDGDIHFVEYQFDNEKFSGQLNSHQPFLREPDLYKLGVYEIWTFDGHNLKGVSEDDRLVFIKE